jgi:methanogenic corrinoid protein MtbC1
LTKAAKIVGDKYASGEFFIADLVMAGEILKEVSELIRPKLKQLGKARSIIGTREVYLPISACYWQTH